MYGRPKPKPSAARLPAAIGMMAAEVEARPFGSSGEFLVLPRPEPRTVAQPFQPPVPDWATGLRERREQGEAVASDPAPLVNPVAAMLAEANLTSTVLAAITDNSGRRDRIVDALSNEWAVQDSNLRPPACKAHGEW